ncbi:MAG: DUF4097 family beta strand repeat protein [Gemmatimonadaceae bacterium]|nr:DUF4097 family beta strand repeat protein [Gemmatimonadaceae bacterium]
MRVRSLAVLMLAAAPLAAQQKVDARYAVTRDVYVRINGAYAALRIVGWQKDSLVLTGTLPRGTRVETALGAPADGPRKGAKFYIEPPTEGGASGTLELFVPVGATVWAKAGNARFDVSGITGSLDLNLVGGAIAVNGAPRELNVESMDGSVDITGSPGWLRVKTATGEVTVRGSSSDVGITTVGGGVTLRDGTWERVRIEAVTGDVMFGGTMRHGGNLTIDSHSGTISLQLGATPSIDIDATTIAGTIINSVSARRPTPGREGRGEELTLALGVGDARATLRSFKGNIRLNR